MFFERVHLTESFTTHFTQIWLLSIVLPKVHPPSLSVKEGLVTEGAAERLLSCVSPHVKLKLGGGEKEEGEGRWN